MALRLNGSSSGYVELDVPAAAGSHTLTLPDGGGSSGNFLRTDGSGTLTWATPTNTDPFHWTTTSGSAVTSIDFTLPTNARQVTIAYYNWDPGTYSGGENQRLIIRFGTGATPTFKNSGYRVMSANNNTTTFGINSNNYSGISAYYWNSNSAESGTFVCTRAGDTTWHFLGRTNVLDSFNYSTETGGYFDLDFDPTAVRLTTIGGTTNFTSGDFSVGYLTDG